ncbi:MAG TPA: AIR synthase related protein, partial [Candidatus Saccharimonadales bacterium]|nr:AIR synthase related protein [Candidatus Saccharimonadales bacterium]
MTKPAGGEQPYDYKNIDPSKVNNIGAAKSTIDNAAGAGFRVQPESYGESVAVIDFGPLYLAGVLEGIGTKNMVAELVDDRLGTSHAAAITQCNAGTMVNDLSTCGAEPRLYWDFQAAGDDQHFADETRSAEYTVGKKAVCDQLGITWTGGETQVLKDVIFPGRAVMAGFLLGDINPKSRRITGEDIQAGDAVTVIESSGAHANGYSLLRQLAEMLPQKYDTELPDGTPFGEALLAPTYLYSKLVKTLLDRQVEVHRIENITGHGWAKLMRAAQPYTYEIDQLPPALPLFEFIQ